MIDGVPLWMFYAGTAAIMTISFAALILAGGGRPAAMPIYPTFDLLRLRPVSAVLHWRPFRFLAQGAVVSLFLLVIVAGLYGRQEPGANVATLLTWTYWWILLVLVIMFFGKVWCYVCPWDALATWLERLTFWKVTPGLSARWPWPKALRNLYPAAVLFVGLTWLELGYGVTTKPEMTAWLALLMFFLAFVPALLFDRRSFCRYGCLVGRISGLYSLFSSLEIRARDREVCRSCTTHDCLKGNERGYPCPTTQYLGAMTKNTYCIACGECIHTCPHDNVAVNLRPFGADLLKYSSIRFDEAVMVIIMLAMSTFHGLTMTPQWNRIVSAIERTLSLPYLAAFTIGMVGFLVGLSLIYVVLVWVSHLGAGIARVTRRELALRYAYAFLPIALFYHFAHNTTHFAVEGGGMLALVSDPLGWGWNLFGTARTHVGPLMSANATWLLTVGLIIIGHVWSLVLGHRVAKYVFVSERVVLRSEVPILVAMIAYSVLSLWIVAQPMEMRTGL
jgi:polyferredoxin